MSLVFFTDRDLGKKFPAILSEAGFSVERHADHFDDAAADTQWLEAIARHGWIALTHNERIRYTPNELEAVRRHKIALLVVKGKAPLPELAQAFVRSRLKIETFLNGRIPPFIGKVYQPSPAERARGARAGRVELWWPDSAQ